MQLRLIVLATVALSFHSQSKAGVIFFNNDQAGFDTATANNPVIGTEDFEQGNPSLNTINDPLTQGVANGPFPNGLIQPLTIQSNTSGGVATTPNPRGTDGLAAVGPTFGSTASNQVVAFTSSDSLDLIFDAQDEIAAVGFNPVKQFSRSNDIIIVQVFDVNNVLLDQVKTTGSESASTFFGILATDDGLIGRINLFSTGNGSEGADNIQLFQPEALTSAPVPEPTSLALFGLAMLGAYGYRRKKKATAG